MGYFTGRLPLAFTAGPVAPGAGARGAVEGPPGAPRGLLAPSTSMGDLALGKSWVGRGPGQLKTLGRLPQPVFDADKASLALSGGQLAEAERQHCKCCGGGVVAAGIELEIDTARIDHAAAPSL